MCVVGCGPQRSSTIWFLPPHNIADQIQTNYGCCCYISFPAHQHSTSCPFILASVCTIYKPNANIISRRHSRLAAKPFSQFFSASSSSFLCRFFFYYTWPRLWLDGMECYVHTHSAIHRHTQHTQTPHTNTAHKLEPIENMIIKSCRGQFKQNQDYELAA